VDVVLGTSGLISYWRLGEHSGTTAADSKGGNAGTYGGGFTLSAPGALSYDADSATSFNGSSGRVALPNNASLNLTGDLTLEAWVKPSAVDNAQAVVAKAGSAASVSNRQFRLGLTNGQWRGTLWDTSGGTYNAIAATAPAAGTWQHVVFTVSGSSLTIYVNGVQSGTATFSGTRNAVNSGSAIARLGDGSREFFAGTVDEVAIYNVALTAAQVQAHYSAR
jgi:hypothetical protein